jgi:RsiW-degrading membrane proteinase PrsW (M82 family)
MIDGLTGHQGAAIVSFRGLFSDTFKRHSKHDIDSLLYSGTAAVAIDPQPYRLPWLYARVGGILLAAFLTLWVTYEVFYGTGNVIPGLLFTGALVVPASLMVFFWEANQARNVSIFDLIRIFFIGGAVSILLTFVIGEVLPADVGYRIGEAAFSGLLIGITEETAKGLVVVVLIRKLRGNLILNGLLIGAAVGTGFAVFETAGYGMTAWLYSGDMAQTLLIRSFLSIGSHVVWTAMAGAAFMLAQRPGRDTASINNLAWKRFLPLFGVAVALHAVWDFFAFVIDGDTVYYLLCVLIAAAWIIIVRLMNSGLRQQVLADQAGAAARPPAGFAPFGPTGLPGPVAGSGAAPLTVPPGVSGPFAAAVPGLAADRPEPVSGFGSAAQGPLAAAPAASVSPFAPAAPISPFAPAVGNMAAPVPAASVSPLVPETGNVTEPVPAAGPPWGGPTAAAPEMASPPAEPTGSAASPGTDG